MLRVDAAAGTLTRLETTTLTRSQILERQHLQRAIVASWDAFRSELGLPDLYFVGEEVVPHESCRDRIDILAIDADARPHVIELKRHRDRLQLLQALSYAAMISTWSPARYLDLVRARPGAEAEDLCEMLRSDDLQLKPPRVVLLAESFDPEVILTANWLAQSLVSVSAFAISALDDAHGTLLAIEQRFPPAGIDDLYVSRAPSRRFDADGAKSWNDVLPELSFDFAADAVAVFQKRKPGDPTTRRFLSMYGDTPLGSMHIRLTGKHITIHTLDQSPEAEEILRERLGPSFTISRWGSEQTSGSGYSFKIQTREQFERFLTALSEPTCRAPGSEVRRAGSGAARPRATSF